MEVESQPDPPVTAQELRWHDAELDPPVEGQIVLVHGGVAVYRDGVFYTGMEVPQYQRPIQWTVTHWAALPIPPMADGHDAGCGLRHGMGHCTCSLYLERTAPPDQERSHE